MEDLTSFLEVLGLADGNWLAIAALWYIGWNLRALKTAPRVLRNAVKELKELADSVISALNRHADILNSVNKKLERHETIKIDIED